MKVLPHTIPGTLHSQNQTAFDWGWQGLVAYGCQGNVVVVDPRSVQLVQVLSRHKSNIIKVRWSRECYHHTLASPYSLRLASVDTASHCVVWDVAQATVITEFSLGNKPLVDVQWLTTNDSCRDLLAVMISPSSMTIWNADTGTKVSRFTFTETIVAFVFNPFQSEHLVLQSPDCFIFVNDFNPSRTPSGGGKKLYMTGGGGGSGRVRSPNHHLAPRRLLSGDNLKGEEAVPLSDCIQVTFSHAQRHHLLVVYPREIVIMDIEIKQTVGAITLERNTSPFIQVMPCKQRNMLYCLHENGCVSVRIQQNIQFPASIPTSPLDARPQDVGYDLHGHSEPLRISKTCQVFAGAFCPTTEQQVAILTSEGKILFWDIEFEQVGVHGQELPEESVGLLTLVSAYPSSRASLVEVREDGVCGMGQVTGTTLGDTIAPHWFVPPEDSPSPYSLLTFKLMLGGLWTGITGTPTTVRMCPPLTTKNWSFYTPLLAVGTSGGSVLVFNLSSRTLVKEYAVHTCCVHGIEWINQSSFASYAHTHPNSSGNVRNEIATTDIQTGRITHLKRGDSEGTNQTPVELIRISTHKHYLVVKYKDRPLEFWDTRSLSFLRELISNPATFSCIEWSPTHGKSKPPKADPTNATVDFDVAMGTTDSKISQSPERELLTVMDDSGAMWQIAIEGSKVRVVNSAPTQTWLNTPSCVTWKGDLMAAGDVEGTLIFYDSRNAQARSLETLPRAVVKKLRFAPGKGNTKMLVLYTTRLDIRDALGDTLLSQMKWAGSKEPSSHLTVEDADWATSDKPVLLTSDGCVRVYDLKLQSCQAAINAMEFAETLFCPYAVLPQSCFRLKSMLQHQPWNLEYSLDANELDELDTIERGVKHQLQVLPEDFHVSLLDVPLGTAQRCLITATLYGDEREADFWTIALYYMLREKNRLQDPRYMLYKNAVPRNPSSDIIRPDSDASISIIPSLGRSMDDFLGPLSDLGLDSEGESLPSPSLHSSTPPPSLSFDLSRRDVAAMLQEAGTRTLSATPPLDLGWDLLCDSETFQRMQLDRVLLHDSKRYSYDQTRRCAEKLLLLGQTDRAVQLLLETDSSSSHYYSDALKACLAATIRSSGASQSTIKLVATNLIANSRLSEGTQLLCLIDKGLDACRYLQTYSEWQQSVWLAKATLSERDCSEVFTRWVDHLSSVGINQKNTALLVLLSLGQFQKVIEMLYSMRYFDNAAVFTEACLEYGLVKLNKETAPLVEAVFLEYARYLQSLGLSRGMRHYCGRAGEKGKQLLEQYLTSGHKKQPGLAFSIGDLPT